MNTLRKARPHQIEATTKVLAALKTQARTQLIMACGTGKTLTSLRIAEQGKFKRIVVFVPSLALVSQVLKEYRTWTSWKKWSAIAVCSDETVAYDYNKISPNDVGCEVVNDSKTVRKFVDGDGVRVVFCTYHSASILKKLEFDLGIFDEAHKTAGAKGKAFSFALFDRNVKINRRLFLTATPRHVKVSEDSDEVVYSMDDETVYGTAAYRLSLGEAIEAGLVCDYKIVICLLLEDIDIGSDNYTAAQVALHRTMVDYRLKRAITFHSDIARAQKFAADTKGALRGYSTWHINGSMSAEERKERLDGMIKEGGITTNVRCLSEGVDFPVVDSVAFIDPKRSAIDIVQSVGRCLRLDKSNPSKLGTVLIPVYVKRGENDEDAVARSKFGYLHDVLQSLKEIDPKLGDELRRKASGGKGLDGDRIDVIPFDTDTKLDLETLQKAITVRLFSTFKRETKEQREAQVKNYFMQTGQLPKSGSLYEFMKVTCSPSSKRYDPAFKKWCRDHGFNRIDPEFRKDQIKSFFEQYNQLPSKTTEPALYANMVSYSREDIEFGQWCRDRGYQARHTQRSSSVAKEQIKQFYKENGFLPKQGNPLWVRMRIYCKKGESFDTEFNQWCRERGLGMGRTLRHQINKTEITT